MQPAHAWKCPQNSPNAFKKKSTINDLYFSLSCDRYVQLPRHSSSFFFRDQHPSLVNFAVHRQNKFEY